MLAKLLYDRSNLKKILLGEVDHRATGLMSNWTTRLLPQVVGDHKGKHGPDGRYQKALGGPRPHEPRGRRPRDSMLRERAMASFSKVRRWPTSLMWHITSRDNMVRRHASQCCQGPRMPMRSDHTYQSGQGPRMAVCLWDRILMWSGTDQVRHCGPSDV